MILKWLGLDRGKRTYVPELGHTLRELPPINQNAAVEFISIPAMDIPTLAEQYFAAMETEESKDWCRCEWIIHPDDVAIDRGNCRECNQPAKSKIHQVIDEICVDGEHRFRGIRMRKGDGAPDCPVHTREGMVIYFFEWVFSGKRD